MPGSGDVPYVDVSGPPGTPDGSTPTPPAGSSGSYQQTADKSNANQGLAAAATSQGGGASQALVVLGNIALVGGIMFFIGSVLYVVFSKGES